MELSLLRSYLMSCYLGELSRCFLGGIWSSWVCSCLLLAGVGVRVIDTPADPVAELRRPSAAPPIRALRTWSRSFGPRASFHRVRPVAMARAARSFWRHGPALCGLCLGIPLWSNSSSAKCSHLRSMVVHRTHLLGGSEGEVSFAAARGPGSVMVDVVDRSPVAAGWPHRPVPAGTGGLGRGPMRPRSRSQTGSRAWIGEEVASERSNRIPGQGRGPGQRTRADPRPSGRR